MPILKRTNKYQGLKDLDVLVEESGLSSQYFNVLDVPENIPKGSSSFLIAGSELLKNNVELRVEILDSQGNPIYSEAIPNYLEGNARRVSIEVYDDTAPGDGFLYIVGELKDGYENQRQVPTNEFNINTIKDVSPFDVQLEKLKEQAKQGVQGALGEIDDIVVAQQQRQSQITQDRLQTIPKNFQGVYNVRYVRPIFINSTIPNTLPIIFHKQPTITATEIVKGFVVPGVPVEQTTITGSASVTPTSTATTIEAEKDPVDGFPNSAPKEERDKVGSNLEHLKNRRSNKIDTIRKPGLTARGRVMRRFSPEEERFNITIDSLESSNENSVDKASSALVGADLTINNPRVDNTKYPTSEYTIPDKYTSKIKKVKNTNTLVPQDDFLITKKDTGEKIPVDIETDATPNVTMSYTPTPQQSVSTTHFRSFADITVGNLRTFSGDVFKAKLYAKSQGSLSDFELLYESPVQAPQTLIDPYSTTGFVNTGYFYTQSIADNYWITSNGTSTRNDDYIIDGILVSGSNEPKNNSVTFSTSQSIELEKNVPYTITFDAYYLKQDKVTDDGTTLDANLKVYLTGSALSGAGGEEDTFLGEVDLDNVSDTQGSIRGIYNTFITSNSGDPKTQIKFQMDSGQWILSDVTLKPYSETNFNPDYFRFIVPMPHPMPKKPDKYDFLVEFYDTNNNIAETFAITESVDFVGAPINIDGDNNLLSGSMYMGNVQGSGIELHGGSAYMRSLGYNGFDRTIAENKGGFLMFSGSVSESLGTSQSYDGVGIELVDAHGATDRFLRFRTQPSIFEVVTDTFFLGSADSAFVSGSGGNIEISSSNFHLTNTGDVTMSGVITATAGNIGDWQISDGDIVGSNITMDANNSTIFKTDQGPGSDSGAAFDHLRDEYYIDFTPEVESPDNFYIKMGPNFMVDKDGILIASGATFEGSITASAGLIGGFTTDSHSFSSPNIFISGSPKRTGTYTHLNETEYMFISTSKFNVKQSGDITGSNVLFSGGQIGGFELTSTQINSTNDNLILKSSGHITGSQVLFTGGKIAGFEISGNKLQQGTSFHLDGGATGNSYFISSSNFQVEADGDVSGSSVFFDGGKIGGWILSDTTLANGTDIVLDSSNKRISINNSTFGGDGVQLEHTSGGGKLYAGDGSTSFLKFDGTDVQLSAPKMFISSSGGGTIAMGDTIPQNLTSDGLMLSGSGDFNFQGNATNLVRKIGTALTIKSETFSLTGTNLEISNDKLSIGNLANATDIADDSTGFHVDSSGNVLIKQGSANTEYLQFQGGGIDIKAGTFDLATSTLVIDSGTKSGQIALGATPNTTGSGTNAGIYMDGTGDFLAYSNSTNYIRKSFADLDIKAQNFDLDAGTLILDSGTNNGKIALGGTPPTAYNSGTGFYVDGNGKLLIGIHDGNRIQFDGSDFTIVSNQLQIDTTNIDINTTTKRIQVFNDSGDEYVRIGETSDAGGSDDYGMKIYDGSGTADSNTLVKFGEEGNRIAGWTIDDSNIFSDNLFIRSAGTIETADFASNLKGWRISAEGNGTAEFENARIRGTLSTAVFEKESVNAVGGQLYVANSTTLTGSGIISASYATMSVKNATGFVGSYNGFNSSGVLTDASAVTGEILQIKKIGNTGFSTEYVLIQSASRDFPDSSTNFAGKLFVSRSWGSGNQGDFVGDLASNAQDYEEGQVLVSTGRYVSGTGTNTSGSGYIKLNANPNDVTTPYIDIVERTGSGIYDVDLKVRVGDLSGVNVSEFAEFGIAPANAGFGIYTSNGYFTGGITATTGSITGQLFVHTGVGASNRIIIGTDVNGSNDGISVNDHNYWYTTGQFKVGSANNFLSHDGSGDIQIQSEKFELDSTDLLISSTHASMSLGQDTDPNNDGGVKLKGSAGGSIGLGGVIPANLSSNGIFMSGSGEFNLQKDANEYLRFTNSNGLELKTENLNVNTSTFDVQTDGGGKLALGSSATNFGTPGIFMSGSGGISIYRNSTNYLIMTGSTFDLAVDDLQVSTSRFEVTSSGIEISSTQASMSLGGNRAINLSGTGTGSIKVGNGVASVADTGGSNKGVYIEGNGDVIFKAGANKYLQFNDGDLDLRTTRAKISGSNIEIGTTNLDLDVSTMRLSSSNSGVIALGATPPVAYNSGNGFYVDGTGKFLIGNTSGNFINFDGSATFNIKTTQFELDTANLDISSADQKIDLGGGKIVLDADGGTGGVPIIKVDGGELSGSDFFVSTAGALSASAFLFSTNLAVDTNAVVNFGDASYNSYAYGRNDSLKIVTGDFNLTTNTLIASSSNNGVIALGSTPPKIATAGSGIFLKGDGTFLFGDTSANHVNFDGSTLSIKTADIDLLTTGGNKIKLDSTATTPVFAMGSTTLNTSVSGTEKGIFMDGTGDFLVRGDANNLIKFDAAGNTLQIKSDTFGLDAGTINIDSATNNGKIALGVTPPTAYNSGNGFYADGTGKFLVGSSTGSRISFNGDNDINLVTDDFHLSGSTTLRMNNSQLVYGASAASQTLTSGTGVFLNSSGHFRAGKGDGYRISWDGTNSVISSSTFFLGSKGGDNAYISSSGNNLEISSSGYALLPDGQATFMTGSSQITFQKDGNIASDDYLIERSRLFGAGTDGEFTGSTRLSAYITGNKSAMNRESVSSTFNATNAITSSNSVAFAYTGSDEYHMTNDVYCNNLQIDSGVKLCTHGYRLFVKKTLTNSGTIHNNGFTGGNGGAAGGSPGVSGSGGYGGTLQAGANGGVGGRGNNNLALYGGTGGSAGGTGGIVLIFARTINQNSGSTTGGIQSQGGNGGNGGSGDGV